MNVLLIGNGGREHALAKALTESPSVETLYCAPGNPGILTLANHADCRVDDHASVVRFCREFEINFVVVGPEAPLADGLADSLRAENILVFGPSKAAAQLEWSKGFAKEFMKRHHIPTAAFARFTLAEYDTAHAYIRECDLPVVLKADGLAAGKGVIIAETRAAAVEGLDGIFKGKFGEAGKQIVIEEFLKGEEASVFAICDGERFVMLAPAQDHKRAFDDDEGENTGGMGAYAPALIVTEAILEKVRTRIVIPVLNGMKEEGMPFTGCLFVGLMIDNGEPRVVEFNVRFGDPETQVVLTVLRADVGRLLFSAAEGALDEHCIEQIADGHACCVVMASGGYPGSYEKGKKITGIHEAEQSGAFVFHAGTVLAGDDLVTAGGRVLAVCGTGATLETAIAASYAGVEHIEFEGKMYRRDIGKKGIR